MISQMEKELLRVLKYKLFSKEQPAIKHDDVEELLEEAERQGVLSLAFSAIKPQPGTEEALKKHETLNFMHLNNNMRNLYQHGKISELLKRAGVPHVVLKGPAAAFHYPEPLLRKSGDVDILIHETDLLKCDEVLVLNGFEKREETDQHDFHWGYVCNDTLVEIHWDPPGIPAVGGEEIDRYVVDVIEKSNESKVVDVLLPLPSEFHHGMILLLHTVSHATGGGIGLRHLCDWLVFENGISEENFVNEFEAPLRRVGLWNFAKVMTQMGVLFMGCEPRQWCEDADAELCEELLEDILSGGDFGRKDDLRKSQAKLYRDNESGMITKRKMAVNLGANLRERVMRTKKARHVPGVLMPFIWIGVACEYVFRVIIGKRNNVLNGELLKGAQKRQGIYARLELFEKAD